MPLEICDEWIVPFKALDVWRVAKSLDFSPLEWRIYDKHLERIELAIKLWRPRVWDVSGPEAAALGAMGSEYKAAAGWITVTDLAGVSCHLHGRAESAAEWDLVCEGWAKLIYALFNRPLGDWTLVSDRCRYDAELERETVDQNVEPYFVHQAELLENVKLERKALEDGRIQYDMFKHLTPPPPGYKAGESVPAVPTGALVRLQLIRLGERRTQIYAWARGVNFELDNSWLPGTLKRFVSYLHQGAGIADAEPIAPAVRGELPELQEPGPGATRADWWTYYRAARERDGWGAVTHAYIAKKIGVAEGTEKRLYATWCHKNGFPLFSA